MPRAPGMIGKAMREKRMRKERKNYTSEKTVPILRRHLLDKIPAFDLHGDVAGPAAMTSVSFFL
jgi:hypothetical protein